MVRSSTCSIDHSPTIHSSRHCHGHHKSAQQPLSYLPTHLRRGLSRQTSRQHGKHPSYLSQLSSSLTRSLQVFVTYCYISSAQGIKFSSDLKLGHYMKIPPKLLFKVQMVATLLSSITQIGVLNWMFKYIPNICTPDAINGFTCPIARVHFNGSILWGVVGPRRFFGEGALYRPLIWAFLVGFVAPILIWLIGRRSTDNSIWRKINLPVLFGSLSWIPPAVRLSPVSAFSQANLTDRPQLLRLGPRLLPL